MIGKLQMKFHRLLRLLSVGLILAASAFVAHADTLTFDDITTDVSIDVSVPNGYGDFDWNEFHVVHKDYYHPESGYTRGTVSGNYTAFNWGSQVATVNDTLFDFNSAYLTAAWNTGLNIQVEGFLGGVSVHNTTVVVDNTGPTLFNFDFLGIDSLFFTSFGGVDANPDDGGSGTHFAMDNFTYNVIPLPSAALLGMLGMGLVGLCRRWRA